MIKNITVFKSSPDFTRETQLPQGVIGIRTVLVSLRKPRRIATGDFLGVQGDPNPLFSPFGSVQ